MAAHYLDLLVLMGAARYRCRCVPRPVNIRIQQLACLSPEGGLGGELGPGGNA